MRLLKKARTALLAACVLAPQIATAFSITSVAVVPADPIRADDAVSIVVGIATPSQDAFLYAATVVERVGNTFDARIFIDDGRILPATDYLEETLSLGTLGAGVYGYVIRITPGYDVDFGVREVAGSFTVVPVPAPLVLLASALSLLAGTRRGHLPARPPG